jgi:hypothetical protein
MLCSAECVNRRRIVPWQYKQRAKEEAMAQYSLQLLELLEESATSRVEQLEAIIALVEPAHPAHRLLERALHDAREHQLASAAAWKAALEVLAKDKV